MMLDLALAPPNENDGGTRAQFLSMLGREDLFEQPARESCAPLSRNGVAVDPVEEIARRAAGARVVIINEAHERPQHRAFIADVAEHLRRDGFTIYAAETFLPAVREQRQWPSVRDGTYSREPTFGALMRRARAVGYTFAEYEDLSELQDGASQDEQIAWREATQARNIQRILNENPSARLLVHVGHAHLLERPDHAGRVWMAQRLKETTGIDPLTIDQTRYAAPGDHFLFCDPAQISSPSVDIRISSPDLVFEHDRPAWRIHRGQQPAPIPAKLLSDDENVIVEARQWDEPDDAVPVDRVLVQPRETMVLLLAPGRYRVASWSRTSGWSQAVEINVLRSATE
jgi:hypothetical protein